MPKNRYARAELLFCQSSFFSVLANVAFVFAYETNGRNKPSLLLSRLRERSRFIALSSTKNYLSASCWIFLTSFYSTPTSFFCVHRNKGLCSPYFWSRKSDSCPASRGCIFAVCAGVWKVAPADNYFSNASSCRENIASVCRVCDSINFKKNSNAAKL